MSVKTWGDFEIFLDRLLGRGGMGAVYMGRQISLDRPAAIKVLKKDLTSNPEFVKRFNREAALLARLVDNHVVQVFGAGESEGEHFYAMEYVEGEDYASLIKKGKKFTVEEVLRVAESVGLALQAAWRHRIIHRDIKPSNILITKDNETKVMDFGLAKNPESDLTQSEVIMGTAKYMSPEQATGGPCDIRSDLYSLGVVLYELATGQPPFTGEGATAIMYQHVHSTPRSPRQINPALPVEVEKLILRLIEKDPEARFAAPDALISHVRCIQEGVTPDEKSTLYNETVLVGGAKTAPPAAPPGKSSSTAPKVISVAAAALLLAGGAYWVATSGRAEPPAEPPRVSVAAPAPSPAAVPAPVPPPVVEEKAKAPAVEPVMAPSAPAWEEFRHKGVVAFGEGQWRKAYTQLEEAKRLGATDVDAKIREAHVNEHVENAEKGETRGEWAKAAADWSAAAGFSEGSQAEEYKERQAFCARFDDAVRARGARDWARALEIYRELAKNPRGFAGPIEQEIQKAEQELAGAAAMAAKERQREFEDLMARGQAALRKAMWAEAKALFERAEAKEFEPFSREAAQKGLAECRTALSAPKGMVYVPAGKFTMGLGGADRVEGPEWEAQASAFFLDDHETTAAEYGEFLNALNSFGHHPACPKDEPPDKQHVPERWESQKPGDPVTGVSWWDASSYAAWKGKRLPRETEWERAASFDPAGRRLYAWGPRPQAEGGRSYLGIDGMGTGVIEWTADWFQKYPGSTAEQREFGDTRKVLRGGVRLPEDAAESMKVTYRHWYLPTHRNSKVGFRCAQDVLER